MKRKNPWRTKQDVARHNKKCAETARCRREWLRVANSIYNKGGEASAGRAVIAANATVKRKGLKNPREISIPEHIQIIADLWNQDLLLTEITDLINESIGDFQVDDRFLLKSIQEWRHSYGENLFPRRSLLRRR